MVAQVHPDTSDVNIKPLFQWYGKETIKDFQGQEFDVYIRLVGDADLNKARVYALRKSKELRKRIADPNSDEHQAYLPEIEMFDLDSLKQGLILFKRKDLLSEAYKEVRVKHPKEPASDTLLEKQEKYQEELDMWEGKRTAAVSSYIEAKLPKYVVDLDKKDLNTLYKEYTNKVIEQICEMEMLNRFRAACTYYGSFKNEQMTTHFFTTLEEFENLNSEVKAQFLEFYQTLEISADDLKK